MGAWTLTHVTEVCADALTPVIAVPICGATHCHLLEVTTCTARVAIWFVASTDSGSASALRPSVAGSQLTAAGGVNVVAMKTDWYESGPASVAWQPGPGAPNSPAFGPHVQRGLLPRRWLWLAQPVTARSSSRRVVGDVGDHACAADVHGG